MRIRILAPTLLVALTLGCVRYRPAPIAPAQRAAEPEERSLTDAGLQRFILANADSAAAPWRGSMSSRTAAS